jgi:hypothetical protein
MPQRTFLCPRHTCPRHSPGKSTLLTPLALQNTSLSRSPCKRPLHLPPYTCLPHKLCSVAPSSRRCTCTLTLHMPGGCNPTRPLHVRSSHCIHPHQQCSRRHMSRRQRPCRLRSLCDKCRQQLRCLPGICIRTRRCTRQSTHRHLKGCHHHRNQENPFLTQASCRLHTFRFL